MRFVQSEEAALTGVIPQEGTAEKTMPWRRPPQFQGAQNRVRWQNIFVRASLGFLGAILGAAAAVIQRRELVREVGPGLPPESVERATLGSELPPWVR